MDIDKKFINLFMHATEKGAYGASLFKGKNDKIAADKSAVDEMRKVVVSVQNKCLLEASGGINFETVRAVAATGVDLISVGALTHSVKSLDISLEIS